MKKAIVMNIIGIILSLAAIGLSAYTIISRAPKDTNTSSVVSDISDASTVSEVSDVSEVETSTTSEESVETSTTSEEVSEDEVSSMTIDVSTSEVVSAVSSETVEP